MTLPQLIVLDRDAVLIASSSDESSPLYYVTQLEHVILKPNVKDAVALINAHGIPIVLATKQRCLSKGLVSAERVNLIHTRLQRMLDHNFDRVLVEPEHENKLRLFQDILARQGGNPARIHLFDDSQDERTIAARLGFTVHDGENLWSAVCAALKVK